MPALVEEFGVGAPTDIVAVLPALVVESVGDPPFLLVVDAFDVLKARIGLQKVLQLAQGPQRVVVAAEQGNIIDGLPGRLDGLQAVQGRLHHAPETPVDFDALGGENAGGLTCGELFFELGDQIRRMPPVPVERDNASLRSQAVNQTRHIVRMIMGEDDKTQSGLLHELKTTSRCSLVRDRRVAANFRTEQTRRTKGGSGRRAFCGIADTPGSPHSVAVAASLPRPWL